MTTSRKQVFVCAAGCPVPAGAGCNAMALLQSPSSMSFNSNSRASAPPFAWLGASRHGLLQVPPLARMAAGAMALTSDELLHSLLSGSVEERQKAPPRRGHSDEWYQERCVFCCGCKETINSQYHKRGSRCHGCRRWFHTNCMPSGSSGGGSSAQQQAAAAGSIDISSSIALASGEDDANETAQPAEGQHVQGRPELFFHTDECKQVHSKLAAVAAAGEQQLPVPARRGFHLPWQQQQQQQQPQAELQVWRLLDLSEVRALYKDAQRRGTLLKQHAKVQQRLAEEQLAASTAAAAPPPPAEGSSMLDAPQQQQQQQQGGFSRRVVATRLDDFLVVSELLRGLGDTPKELLEESFALITRTESGRATCAATFNVFGADHARLQGLATPHTAQRQGHATRLMQQLECVLQEAGLRQLAVVLHPDGDEEMSLGVPGAASLERWLRCKGFKPAAAEQAMTWRRQLPEYHKSLMAGCTLLVKPVGSSNSRRSQWF